LLGSARNDGSPCQYCHKNTILRFKASVAQPTADYPIPTQNEVHPIRSIVTNGFPCEIIIDSTKAPQQDVGH
jgi:hypothetical protein